MSKIYYFYSNQSEKSMSYLDFIDEIGGESVCVDSMSTRRRLKKLGIHQIPSVVEISAEGKLVLQNQDAIDFLKKFIKPREFKSGIIDLPRPRKQPPRTPISAIPIQRLDEEDSEISESVKKAVKENSIMDKVKMLTKEREDVLLDNK